MPLRQWPRQAQLWGQLFLGLNSSHDALSIVSCGTSDFQAATKGIYDILRMLRKAEDGGWAENKEEADPPGWL